MNYLFFSAIGVYCSLVIYAIVKWGKITSRKLPPPFRQPGLMSVIVPVRNEAHNVGRLLNAIAQQSIEPAAFEVVIVDDYSTDDTLEIVMSYLAPFKISTISLASINEKSGLRLSGKKHAISQGIKHAQGDIIITTDADCYMDQGWLQSIYSFFARFDAQMIVGVVVFTGAKGLFQKMQAIEFATLIGTGAVALDSGHPNMCNGANLAFKKQAFEAVNGYAGNYHIPSGDDEFLLQKIFKIFPNQVFFNAARNSIVYTEPVKEILSFIGQRRRWSSKWKLHKSPAIKILALGVFGFHLGLIISLGAALSGMINFYVFAIGFGAKAITEYIFIKRLFDHYGKALHLGYFLILQCIYSVYVLIFGLLSNFGSFEWKERRYKL